MSYLSFLKTMLVEAIQVTFDGSYPEPDFRNVHCSVEYPAEEMNYPGIWVDYDDAQPLQVAGVDHQEWWADEDGNAFAGPFTRWRFQGYVSYTVTALTSYERDRLYDELVKVFAFGKENEQRKRFREYIEANDFIAANFDFDQIEPRGNAAAPGTPWGTDEIIYERTVNMEVLGEFLTEDASGDLVPISQVIISGYPEFPDDQVAEQPSGTVTFPNPYIPG